MTDDILREIVEAQGWQAGDKLVFTFRPSRRRRFWNFVTRRKPRMVNIRAYDEPYRGMIAIDYSEVAHDNSNSD